MRFLFHRLNPIIIREMRGRMRGRRGFIVLTVHTLLLALLTGIIYATVYYEQINRYNYNATVVSMADNGPTLGKATFIGTVMLLLAIFSFVAPAFGAGAIAGEKERQTYDTLLVTTLAGRQIVLGKLGAILVQLILFMFVSLPILSMAFWFGGIAPVELGLAALGLLVTLFAFTAIGLYLSSRVRTTVIAVSIAYAILIPVVYGIPIFIFFVTEGPFDPLFTSDNDLFQLLIDYFLIFLMAINPFFAAVLTGEAAANGHGYFFYRDSSVGPVYNSTQYWMISPWLIYVIFYTLIGLALLIATVRRVGRVSQV